MKDYHAWLLEQAAALRRRDIEALDCDELAEEVEGMARTARHHIKVGLRTILEHLSKLAYSKPTHRLWRAAISRSRDTIKLLLEESPGLRQYLDEYRVKGYRRARRLAGESLGWERKQWEANLPAECPWTLEQILDEDFFADGDNDGDWIPIF
jgi:hypothetical protein